MILSRGVIRVLDRPATPNPDFDPKAPDAASSTAPFRVFNIGNGNPTPLMDYIGALEEALGITAVKNMMPMQPGDVPATSADAAELRDWVGFAPDTDVREGVRRFVEWYVTYYGKNS
jgi:UDP-glucuronate 4-epimerase